MDSNDRDQQKDFAELGEAPQKGAVGELFAFLGESKKWWLLPIVIAMLLLGILLILGGTGVAPFIYTLF